MGCGSSLQGPHENVVTLSDSIQVADLVQIFKARRIIAVPYVILAFACIHPFVGKALGMHCGWQSGLGRVVRAQTASATMMVQRWYVSGSYAMHRFALLCMPARSAVWADVFA
eukprot:5572994-Pyramimonas_sp.AAC.1